MLVNVSGLFSEIKISSAETVLMRLRNGSKYKLVKEKSRNGKGDGYFLEINNELDKNEAILEFLQNYMREGRLIRSTKKSIQAYMRGLKKSTNTDEICSKIKEISLFESVEDIGCNSSEGEVEVMYSSEDKYGYRSNSYKINEVIRFIIKVRMENLSPFTLTNELGYPAGTIHTWYKDLNELRILFRLYSMNYDEIIHKFEGYDINSIRKFNSEIRSLVLECENITDDLRDKYLYKIDKFSERLIEEESNEASENNSLNIDVIKVITQTQEMWSAFANSNKEKIFEILYNNEEILSMLLKEIYK